MRQGLISNFSIVGDRFTIMVFGEGCGPWTSPEGDPVPQPTSNAPYAVLNPSLEEFRRMLQANHVSFEVAGPSQSAKNPNGRTLTTKSSEEETLAAAAPSVSTEEIRADMRWLRRSGEKVLTSIDKDSTMPLSAALLFQGSWEVHALIDVMHQHFLGESIPSAPPAPQRLPRLLATAPFTHASIKCAEVIKTHGAPVTGTSNRTVCHSAELSGWFFPSQAKRLLELLRVLLPNFACKFTSEPRHSNGINAFTVLGARRVEALECECAGAGSDGATSWKWGFTLTS